MDDAQLEQKLLDLLTPQDVDVSTKMDLDNKQLNDKIEILKEQQDQLVHILKINYWDQIAELVSSSEECESGFRFLLGLRSKLNDNLYHHMGNIYNLRKLRSEYDYIRRNNIGYGVV